MRKLIMGCAVATMMVLSPTSEAQAPKPFVTLGPTVALARCEIGLASWYGSESEGVTASGENYDLHGLTAAHRRLPLQSRIRVTNLKNGRSVILRVNDRGPNVAGRILDVSEAAAERLGFIGSGKTLVLITLLRYPRGYVAEPTTTPSEICPSLE
jgi:peptidoglycan lytic transglycosylase